MRNRRILEKRSVVFVTGYLFTLCENQYVYTPGRWKKVVRLAIMYQTKETAEILILDFLTSLQFALCDLHLVCMLYPFCSQHLVLTDSQNVHPTSPQLFKAIPSGLNFIRKSDSSNFKLQTSFCCPMAEHYRPLS